MRSVKSFVDSTLLTYKGRFFAGEGAGAEDTAGEDTVGEGAASEGAAGEVAARESPGESGFPFAGALRAPFVQKNGHLVLSVRAAEQDVFFIDFFYQIALNEITHHINLRIPC